MRIVTALSLVALLSLAPVASAQVDLPGQDYDPGIPTPGSVLGYPVGQWHVRPDQLVAYFAALAAASDRVSLEEIGRTHEQRPQVLLTVTAPQQRTRLETLRQAHLDGQDGPLVLWFGYSIHGDEASGSNAALLFAYHLAASRDRDLAEMLSGTIILIDPSLNPDGMGRYAQWANGNRSRHPQADPIHREHHQPWLRGRFNHYGFDLNRDWLLLTHPESRARVQVLQRWRPHVVTDFHETRGYDDYFFQPGVPARTHPLTPERNQELTAVISRFHARALDRRNQPYFAREGYDDFYYGKGSTYPDIQGMIGILFEQPSSRGQRFRNASGELNFQHAIGNQLATSLSTLEGAWSHRQDLTDYQRSFFEDAAEQSRKAGGAWVFGESSDPDRTRAMARILALHDIRVHELSRELKVDDHRFQPGHAYAVPAEQRQFRLIQALFETRTRFAENTFYDVSTWTFPLAFDVPVASVRRVGDWLGPAFQPEDPPAPTTPDAAALAWVLPWSHGRAPRALVRLQQAGVQVRVATRPLRLETPAGPRDFERGSLVVLAGLNQEVTDWSALWGQVVNQERIPVASVVSGLGLSGPDLGSPSLEPLKPVRPLLLVGGDASATEAGEVWHLLDQRIGLPLTQVEAHRLDQVNWDRYTHLLMVNGEYAGLSENAVTGIRQWVESGGIVVASKGASAWATTVLLESAAAPSDERQEETPARSYADHDADAAENAVGGAIVSGRVDRTHPLAYGVPRDQLPLFRNGTTFLKPSPNPYETVIRYTEQPLMSGFLGEARTRQLAGSAALIASRKGRGLIVRFADNPNFRGIWYGTQRLYYNALFLGATVDATPVADTETRL